MTMLNSLVRVGLILSGVMTATVVSACAPGSSGQPDPQPSGEASATKSASNGSKIPFDNPKDLSAVKKSCDLLTQEQLDELGMAAEPSQTEAIVGIAPCNWDGDKFAMSLAPDTSSGGIRDFYQQYGGTKQMTKTTVKGYPAGWIDKTDITCRVEVGVAKGAKFAVNYTAYGPDRHQSEPCKQGEKIAAMVLKNIPDA